MAPRRSCARTARRSNPAARRGRSREERVRPVAASPSIDLPPRQRTPATRPMALPGAVPTPSDHPGPGLQIRRSAPRGGRCRATCRRSAPHRRHGPSRSPAVPGKGRSWGIGPRCGRGRAGAVRRSRGRGLPRRRPRAHRPLQSGGCSAIFRRQHPACRRPMVSAVPACPRSRGRAVQRRWRSAPLRPASPARRSGERLALPLCARSVPRRLIGWSYCGNSPGALRSWSRRQASLDCRPRQPPLCRGYVRTWIVRP